jgi:hypothetical protein
MLSTVQLDRHARFAAREVENVWGDDQLEREPWAILAQTQP